MKQVYLAIDGGGTKTDAILFGNVLNREVGRSTNPNTLSEEEQLAFVEEKLVWVL